MNIFEIEQSLLDLFDTIEFNGGEITPEIEEQLAITQQNFNDKVKSYCNVIKQIDADLSTIKDEEDRLKNIKNSKKRIKERLSAILCTAIRNFGDTTRSGGKFVDSGTGKASVRNSVVCQIDENIATQAVRAIWKKFTFGAQINNPDLIDLYTPDDIQQIVHEYNESNNINLLNQGLEANDSDVTIAADDLDVIEMSINVDIPAIRAFDGNARKLLKTLAEMGVVEIKPKVNKSLAKNCITEQGICYNVATLTDNQSLIIK